MTPALRRRSAALLILPLMLLLASCVKFDSAMTISADDKVDAVMLIAVQKQFGGLVKEACNPKANNTLSNATITDYKDDDYVGCTLTAHGVPMSKMAKSASSWTLSHENGQYSFAMANANSAKSGGGPGMTSAMFTDFKIAVTFPGDVTSHNGSSTVTGTTVTWTDPDDMFTGKGLNATAKEATPVQAAMPLILGGVGLIVVIGIALLIGTGVRRRRAASYVEAHSQAGTFAAYYPPGHFGPEPARERPDAIGLAVPGSPGSGGADAKPSGTRYGSPE